MDKVDEAALQRTYACGQPHDKLDGALHFIDHLSRGDRLSPESVLELMGEYRGYKKSVTEQAIDTLNQIQGAKS